MSQFQKERATIPDCWLGLDLGGSHLSTVAIGPDGRVLHRASEPLERRWQQATIISRMVALLRSADRACREIGMLPRGAGIGLPGVVDMARGVTLFLPNLAGQWKGVQLRDELDRALGVPTCIINDVRAFTLAEHAYGAGKDSRHMLGLAIGTGIGGGLILDGQLYLGSEGRAGEMGHQTVEPDGLPCGCGNHGCLETVASGPAITAHAARAVLQGLPSVMPTLVDHDISRLTPAVVGVAAASGDEPALAILRRAGAFVGIAIGNLIEVLNPDCVVIGGGVAQAGDPLFAAINATVRERCRTVTLDRVRIVPATLGIDAGMIGAAEWARLQSGHG